MGNRYMDFAFLNMFGEIPDAVYRPLARAKVGRCLDDLRQIRREDLMSIKGIGLKRLSVIDNLIRKEVIWYKE